MTRALLALLLLSGLCGFAVAAPASIDDCERIKGVDAYNYCLASFGPRRGAQSGGGGRRRLAQSTLHKASGNPAKAQRGASGRISVLFDVGSHRKPRN